MQISLYVIITVVIIYLIISIIGSIPAIAVAAFEKVSWGFRVLKPIILGFVFAYIMDPVVDFFEKQYHKLKGVKHFNRIVGSQHRPRWWAASPW
jgi:predicted PurR-regulated permease PerM